VVKVAEEKKEKSLFELIEDKWREFQKERREARLLEAQIEFLESKPSLTPEEKEQLLKLYKDWRTKYARKMLTAILP
jgi:hypothetical protein